MGRMEQLAERFNPEGGISPSKPLGNSGPDQKPFAMPDSPAREPLRYEQETAVVAPWAPNATSGRSPGYPNPLAVDTTK